MAVYTDVSTDDLARLLADLRHRRTALLQGHRRGRREFELSRPHDARAISSSRSTRSASRKPICRSSSALMEHLAARGLNCPQPVQEPAGRGARRARRAAGGDRHLPRRPVGAAAERQALRRGRRGAGRSCIIAGGDFTMKRVNALSVDGWRPLVRTCRPARRHGAAGPVQRDRQGAGDSGESLAARSAAGRHPCRPVSRQRLLPRRHAVGPDRLLFRLQRHAGL